MTDHDDLLAECRDVLASSIGRQGASITWTDSAGVASELTDATTAWIPGEKYSENDGMRKQDIETATVVCDPSEISALDTRATVTRDDDDSVWTIVSYGRYGADQLSIEVQRVIPREVSAGRQDFHGPQRVRRR